MGLDSTVQHMMWLCLDAIVAVGILAALYFLFFRGGASELIALFANGIWN
jgi:hypothetical protein